MQPESAVPQQTERPGRDIGRPVQIDHFPMKSVRSRGPQMELAHRLCYEGAATDKELPVTQIDGPEERAATVLTGGMIMLLSALLAAVAIWGASDYLLRAVTQDTGFWRPEIFDRFLIPLGLIAGAVRGFRFGLRMMRSQTS